MIIQRYILKQIMLPFVLICALLSVLLLAEAFGEVLTRALSGTLPRQAVALLMLYQLPPVLQELIPGGFFLALVVALGQMTGANERVVLQATGYSDTKILRLILSVGVLATVVLYAITLFLAPAANRATADLNQQLASRPAAELVQPGQFTPIDGDGSILYAQSSDARTGHLLDVFLSYQDEEQERMVTARSAQVVTEESGRYMRFRYGHLYSGNVTDDVLEQVSFEELDLLLEQQAVSGAYNRYALNNRDLLDSAVLRNQVMLQWRLLYPLSLLVFCIWAVNLTRYTPRSGKNAAILPAVIFYLLYQYICRTVNSSVGGGNLPIWANFWWIHILGIGLGLALRLEIKQLFTKWRSGKAVVS